MYDLAIVGAGPAGLTAAVYAARKLLSVVMVTLDIGGQTNLTSEIENYMGFEYISGAELARKFQEQVQQFPVTLKLGTRAESLRRAGDHFVVRTSDGEDLEARAVILCTGKRSRPLGVAGEKELVGRGVSYCATCDGPFFRGVPVAVVGGGNSGVTAALELSKLASSVTLLEITDTWRADPVLLEQLRADPHVEMLLQHQVIELQGEGKLTSVVIESAAAERRTLAVEGLFIEIGLIPNTDWLGDLVQLNQWKEIAVDCTTATSVPGVFAAGDVASTPQKQIIIAAGEGAKAALGAFEYLLRQGLAKPTSGW